MKYNVAVIGGGMGGYVAAIRASQLGAKVVLFEEDKLGGTCLNRGCIPTKSFLKSAHIIDATKNAARYGVSALEGKAIMPEIVKRKNDISNHLSMGVRTLLKKNKIDVENIHAEPIDNHKIKLPDGRVIESDNIILALGSVPAKPPIPGIENAINSDRLLDIDYIPQKLIIVGGGVIGVEFATAFKSFGSEIEIIEMADRLLPIADKDISEAVKLSLVSADITLHLAARVLRIDKGAVTFDKNGNEMVSRGELILVCTGRTPNSDCGLLDRLSIKHHKGYIETDEYLRTSVAGIYAVGDVNGKSMLAHTAAAEGTIAAEHIWGIERPMDYAAVPSCVYSSPECAWVGLTEEQAKIRYGAVDVGVFPMHGNGRWLVEGVDDGFVKIISDPQTGEVLGAHIFAPFATEIVGEIGAVISAEGIVADLSNAIHAHPTISEAVHEAALACEGKSIHI